MLAELSVRTIQAAINAAGPSEHSSSGTYPEFLEIKNKNIVLEGGYTGCGTAPGLTIIDASSHPGHSVLNIQGSSSDLLYQIELTGGSAPGQGGGIAFLGNGELNLGNVMITENTAVFGAGIGVHPNGPTKVFISADTVISNNTASGDGGGINVDGQTTLYMVEANTTIIFNHAPNGRGGGVNITGPAAYLDLQVGSALMRSQRQRRWRHGPGKTASVATADVFGRPGPSAPDIEQSSLRVRWRNLRQRLRPIFKLLQAMPVLDTASISTATTHRTGPRYTGTAPATFPTRSARSRFPPRQRRQCPYSYAGFFEECALDAPCTTFDGNRWRWTRQPDGGTIVNAQADGFSRRSASRCANSGGDLFFASTNQAPCRASAQNCLIADNIASGNLIDAHNHRFLTARWRTTA
jgi:predicted outer membrane repeat protein